METIICPRCKAENPPGAMNCTVCHINLKFALENPAEVERLVQENARSGGAAEGAWAKEGMAVSAPTEEPVLRPVLLLLGSFTFAFCLGEAVHELGHYLAHRAYGYDVGLVLDPFGGSHTLGSTSPQEIWGVTTAAGPLLNLLVSMTLFALLWRKRRPALLPLLLWAPLALVQEGVNFSLGSLTPGGDFELIVNWGFPAPLLLALGIIFLTCGVVLLCWELPLVGLSVGDSFSRKLTIVAGGMASFMLVRALFVGLTSPGYAQEEVTTLIFSLLLAAIVSLLFDPVQMLLKHITKVDPASIGWREVYMSIALGLGMVLFQLAFFN